MQFYGVMTIMKLQILTIFLLHFCIAFQDDKVHYIASESSGVCPIHFCPTLSELVTSERINSSTIVVFLPGNHTLNSILYVTNITRFSMISSSMLWAPVITCLHNTSFELNKIGQIAIQRLIFIGCGNNRVILSPHFTLANSTFIGQNGSGTALELIDSTANIFNTSFAFNIIGSYRGPVGIVKYWNGTENKFSYVGGAIIANQSNVTLVDCYFEENIAHIGGAVYSTMGSSISILNCIFVRNFAVQLFDFTLDAFGGAIHCENRKSRSLKQSVVVILNNVFHNNSASHGGAVCAINDVLLKISSTKFSGNFASLDGGVLATYNSTSHIHGSLFMYNHAVISGGVFMLYRSIFSLSTSYFQYNEGIQAGGVMSLASYCTAFIHGSKFFGNKARFGGVINMAINNVTVIRSEFDSNSANSQGAVVNGGLRAILYIGNCNFTNNSANQLGGGVISFGPGKHLTINGSRFIRNRSNQSSGGVLSLINVAATLYNCQFLENSAQDGGVMITYQSSITFDHISNLTNNTAVQLGGGIFAIDSKIVLNKLLVLAQNKAYLSGGGAYLHHSQFVCQTGSLMVVDTNQARYRGGGMHMSNTYIIIHFNRFFLTDNTATFFAGNRAGSGGALYLEDSSAIHIIKGSKYTTELREPTYNLYFIRNTAVYGAAVFVSDETYYGVCSRPKGHNSYTSECFFQVLSPSMTPGGIYRLETIFFGLNNASGGSILFGGLLDRCTLRHNAEIINYNYQNHGRPVHEIDGFTYLKNVSNLINKSDSEIKFGIISRSTRACFCNSDGIPDCNYQPPAIEVKKGEQFRVSVAAVDQVNHRLKNVRMYCSLRYKSSDLGDSQAIQVAKQYCTSFLFNVRSYQDNERLTLYANGPCRQASFSKFSIDIKFKECKCPIGFQVKASEKADCVCVCDSRFDKYITKCNAINQTLLREGSFWIAYYNSSTNSSGYIMYKYCPLDYCLPAYMKLQINLTKSNGADVQCANNRSGLLCGRCQLGFSLSLGSSRCIQCSKIWYVNFLVILFVSFLCGIGLVALLLFLNLSVAVGTLNGLIFYANIIDSSKSTFFTSSTKAFSVFISMLNLEIGFDVCFIKGLDTYGKTWLQLLFPMYVISLVIMIIIVSRFSIRFSMLIAKKNPVATLATLILLSYMTLLRTIITVLSQAKLKYTDIGHKKVWLPDATIDYLTGKHIPFFLVSILILAIGIIYTLLLFCWQWMLKRMKYHRLCHFFEAYHAPYEFKHRYWTGLLLFARIGIYFLIILYGHGNPNNNLLAIIAVTSVLLFVKGHIVRHIYKDFKIDIIETICYLNIVLLSAVKLALLNFANQAIYHSVATYFSGIIALLVLLYSICYQVFSEVLLKLWKQIQQRRNSKNREIGDNLVDQTDIEYELLQNVSIQTPTSSIIEGQPPRE